MNIIDDWLPGLLEKYGNKAGISKKDHANGQARYRIVTVPNTLGVWISKQETFNILCVLALNDPKSRDYYSLEKKLYASQAAAA